MIRLAFSVLDIKTHCFLDLFLDSHAENAKRTFAEVCQNPETRIHKFPRDFDLYLIGTFDTSSGRLVSQDTPERIAGAVDYVEVK